MKHGSTALRILLLSVGLLINLAAEESCHQIPAGMVLIPAGEFAPLFRGEKDPAKIKVPAFYLDVLPVTNSDYLEFVRANPKWRRSAVKRIFAEEDYLKDWAADLDPGSAARSNAPVTYVSWFAAKAYAAWKGKRLPTTVEWECAASASPTRSDGENDPVFTRQIQQWYSTPSPLVIEAAGLHPATCFGVHDLHGLVWEWTSDFNTALVTGDARGDTGLDRQLFCGSGSAGANERNNFPAFMRYGFRSSLKANYTVHNLGFRCAKNFEGDK